MTDRDRALNVVAEARDTNMTKVIDVMTPQVVTCHPDDDGNDVMNLMARHQIRRVPGVLPSKLPSESSARVKNRRGHSKTCPQFNLPHKPS